jgi:thiol:disulfide interchange protein
VASATQLPWQPYSDRAIAELTSEQKTVLVDFTADWCLVCQTLKKFVLDTKDVKAAVESNSVVPLLADWTEGAENVEVTRMLEALRSKSVPVLAIFPAGRPHDPIIFRDPYTTNQLLEALEAAGPSQHPSVAAARAR